MITTTTQPANVFSFDFTTGKMKPIAAAGLLPVGSIVTYEDMANPRREYVVTSATFKTYGQPAICEDGHRSTVSKDAIDGLGGWNLARAGRILSTEEIADFTARAEARKVREDAERAEETAKVGTAREALRADYLNRFSWLETVKTGDYASAKLGAKNIRAELKRAFPGVKFSVTSSVYSGGDSVSVHWSYGPTSKEVEKITGKYQEGHFNGMEDIYESSGNLWPELFGGAKYVSESREDGDFYKSVAAQLCPFFGIEPPSDGVSFWNLNGDRAEDVRQTTRALLSVTGLPAGVEIVTVEHLPPGEENTAINDYTGHASFSRYYRLTFAQPATKSAPTGNMERSQPVFGVTVTENDEKNGVEIRFPAKPDAATLEILKASGWKWSRFGACWYHKRAAATLAFAQSLIPEEIEA